MKSNCLIKFKCQLNDSGEKKPAYAACKLIIYMNQFHFKNNNKLLSDVQNFILLPVGCLLRQCIYTFVSVYTCIHAGSSAVAVGMIHSGNYCPDE